MALKQRCEQWIERIDGSPQDDVFPKFSFASVSAGKQSELSL